jgi:parallel beta-helix repeat protein
MRIGRRASLLGLTVVAAVGATPFLLGAGSGQARTRSVALSCGQTVTVSVALTADMSCPGSDGLGIGANGIVVNLNGHTIRGDGTHTGVLDSGHTGVVIENGTVDGFNYGILLQPGASGTVQNVRSQTSVIGIDALGNSMLISGDYALGSGTGILVADGSGAKVIGNWAESSASDGIDVEDATGVSVTGNKATNNIGSGIVLFNSTGLVSGNVADGNSNSGIVLNSVGSGVKSALTASNNRADFNQGDGILSSEGGSNDGGGNVVQDNGTAVQCKNIICHEVSN